MVVVNCAIQGDFILISQTYYKEMYLEGKDAAAIEREVRHLRAEIARRKEKMESPATAFEERRFPTPGVNVSICREYLNLALDYLSEINGGADVRNESEKAAQIIESLNGNIKAIKLSVINQLEKVYSITISDDSVYLTSSVDGELCGRTELDRFGVMEVIDGLRMSEWKAEYTPEQYGCVLNLPTEWKLTIEYNGATASREYKGRGVTPYNFDILLRLMGAEI